MIKCSRSLAEEFTHLVHKPVIACRLKGNQTPANTGPPKRGLDPCSEQSKPDLLIMTHTFLATWEVTESKKLPSQTMGALLISTVKDHSRNKAILKDYETHCTRTMMFLCLLK